jgi:hypothetical protein
MPHAYSVKLGRVDDFIFNEWDEYGIPIYNPENIEAKKFVKVLSVGDTVNGSASEEFVLYSNGTLVTNNIKLTGGIQWTEASSPSKNVYGETNADKPENGSRWPSFDLTTGTWHKEYN